VPAIQTLLERVAALEIEGAVAAAAAVIGERLPIARLDLFELRPASSDVREVASWESGAMRRPRGRIAIEPSLLGKLLQWAQRRSSAVLASVASEAWLSLLASDRGVWIAPLKVDDTLCGLVAVLPAAAAPETPPDLLEGLVPLGLLLAHHRARQVSTALEGALQRTPGKGGGRMRLAAESSEIVGADRGLASVMHRVKLVQSSDLPVVLLGETGSGKEIIAREIHAGSPRADGPFVRVNCGAIPAELIDSALFGHERGSFTGATHQHKGWFERADGGTLFLDEVGELPLAAQVRLLRVLQDGVIERVGGLDSLHVDCRIIAATHRDLPGMVEEGSFREDLWFRLSAFPLEIPPLRERPEDVPALARFFAERTARLGVPPCEPTDEDLELLLAYDWPGNVRELAMVIDRAAILGQGRRLEIAAALGWPRPGRSTPRAQLPARPEGAPPATNEPPRLLSLDEAMQRHIESVLSAVSGRIEGAGGAAELLGINPHTLRSRMRRLGIDWSRFRRSGTLPPSTPE